MFGQEIYAAYVGTKLVLKGNIDTSAIRETAPHFLRGMIETALKNLGQNLPGALCVTEPNSNNTSNHNELHVGNKLILTAARCDKRTKRSRPAGFRRAHSVMNAPFMFPEMLEVPDVRAGAKLRGYIEHLPESNMKDEASILRIVFPTPDYLSEIAVVDLLPFFTAAAGVSVLNKAAERQLPEIEEDHILDLVDVQKTE